MYDPGTGQWMTQDPLGFGGGDDNLTRYVGNNPLNRIDPSGLADDKCDQHLKPHDKIIAKAISEVEDELEKELQNPNGWRPSDKDPGSYGKELEKRVYEKIKEQKERYRSRLNWSGWGGKHHSPSWHHGITIEKDTGKIIEINGDGGVYDKNKHIQIDVIKAKPGYEPKVGDVLDHTQIEDIYDIKANRDGNFTKKQLEKLKSFLNGGQITGDPLKDRKVKIVHARNRQVNGKIVENDSFRRAIKAFGIAGGVLGLSGSVMAMIRYEEHEEQFSNCIGLLEKAKNNKGDPTGRHLAFKEAFDALIDYFGIYFEGTGLDGNIIKEALWRLHTVNEVQP